MTDTSIEPASATQRPTDQAKEAASTTATTAKEQAASVAQTAASEAQALRSQAAGEAKDLLTEARSQLRAQASDQSDRVASLLGDVSTQLRKMADAGEPGMARDVVQQVASQARQMADRLGQGGLDRTLADARRLARNRPGVFLFGAAAAGFLVARVARNVDTHSLAEAAKPTQPDTELAPPLAGTSGPALSETSATMPLGGQTTQMPSAAVPSTASSTGTHSPDVPLPTDGRP